MVLLRVGLAGLHTLSALVTVEVRPNLELVALDVHPGLATAITLSHRLAVIHSHSTFASHLPALADS